MENEIIDVPIELLRITPDVEGKFLKHWIIDYGEGVKDSPHYLYLCGDYEPVAEWMRQRKLNPGYLSQKLMQLLQSIIWEGQKEPILIYKDMRINTGHKRAACLLFLKEKTIKARIVPDHYKL